VLSAQQASQHDFAEEENQFPLRPNPLSLRRM